MTHTTATSPDHQPGADLLVNLIVAFLAPMFLGVSGGDIGFARMAAIQTVNAYRARNHADLLSVAQIVAFGLAALGSLSLSMADDLSLAMTLRLRGNANALQRSAEQNRRALIPRAVTPARAEIDPDPAPAAEPYQDPDEADVIASVAAAQERCATAPSASGFPAAAAQQRQAMWAAAAAKVAAEYTADLHNLPPEQRRAATLRAAALSSCAHDLMSEAAPPPRLRPGALDALLRSAPR